MAEPYRFRGNNYRSPAELAAWHGERAEPALEPELPIVDAHHHLWDDRRGCYSLHEMIADIEQSGHNVEASVFVEARAMYRADGAAHLKSVGEVEFVNGIAAMSASGNFGHSRLCHGVVGNADLTLGDHVEPVLESLRAAAPERFRGIRHSVIWDSGEATKFGGRAIPRHQMADSQFRRGFARVQALGLSYEAWQFYPQIPDVHVLLEGLPEARVIVNHVGGPLGIPPHDRDETFAAWRDQMRSLVKYPNLFCKLGGLGMLYLDWDFHKRDEPPGSDALADAWRPYVETCIELFGVDRCMMESNFPVDKQTCGYGVLWNAMKRITSGCSESQKAALYSGTAMRAYRLPPLQAAPNTQ